MMNVEKIIRALGVAMFFIGADFWPAATAGAQITTSFTQPFTQSDVAAAEAGVVTRILVSEGEQVEVGQVLAELDLDVLRQSKRMAELRANSTAKLRAAQAICDMRSKQKENFEALIRDGHANASELDQISAQLEAALAEFEIAREDTEKNKIELAQIEAQLERRTIRSPIDGVITKLHKRLGEFLAVSDPRFATVVQLDRLKVSFYLDELSLARLKAGQPQRLEVGRHSQPVTGEVIFVSPIIYSDSGTGRLEVAFDNTAQLIPSGVACKLMLDPSTFMLEPVLDRHQK